MAASRTVAVLALGFALTGCDLVFGIDTEARPCELGSFAGSMPVQIAPVEDFSIDWNMTFAVVVTNGLANELDLSTRTLTPIDLGPSSDIGLALAPEGTSLFYTAMMEPPTLAGALRGAVTWRLGATVPHGTFAGTPSADVFGPRRMMLKERPLDTTLLELEDQSGVWRPVGEPIALATERAPNLTPDGLTMVWTGTDDAGMPGVLAAQRTSTHEAFRAPTMIMPGTFTSVQLLGDCKRLYTSNGTMLEEYDR